MSFSTRDVILTRRQQDMVNSRNGQSVAWRSMVLSSGDAPSFKPVGAGGASSRPDIAGDDGRQVIGARIHHSGFPIRSFGVPVCDGKIGTCNQLLAQSPACHQPNPVFQRREMQKALEEQVSSQVVCRDSPQAFASVPGAFVDLAAVSRLDGYDHYVYYYRLT
jgi:hypothetical protein